MSEASEVPGDAETSAHLHHAARNLRVPGPGGRGPREELSEPPIMRGILLTNTALVKKGFACQTRLLSGTV